MNNVAWMTCWAGQHGRYIFKTIPATADDEGSPTIIIIVHIQYVDIWIIWSVRFAPYLQDERDREVFFIQINRNNDTIIIQCMEYRLMQGDLNLYLDDRLHAGHLNDDTIASLNSIIIIVTNY